jgi:hypothetical protein
MVRAIGRRARDGGRGAILSEPVFQLFTLRDGLVLRQEDLLDRAKALAATGTSV